ncbi:MAG: hypothetical protein HQM09_10795, partial [Candidatus Riflebacteria bacterium]|nr:hypothetical protein [Candidatus Riflebacteria bacterium]
MALNDILDRPDVPADVKEEIRQELRRYQKLEHRITEEILSKKEEQIIHNEARLRSIVTVLQYRAKTLKEFLDNALNEAIQLTESRFGYIYFYHEDQKQFVLNTWSNDVMKQCTIANPQTCYELDK